MSRISSRSSSVASKPSDAAEDDDDEFLADNIMAFHRLTDSFILVQNPVDQKTRIINFSSKQTYRNKIRCDRAKIAGDTGLQVNDEIWAYFSPTQSSPQGYYKAVVRGVYKSEAECKAAEKMLKSGSKSAMKRKMPSLKGRNGQLRKILEPEASDDNSDDPGTSGRTHATGSSRRTASMNPDSQSLQLNLENTPHSQPEDPPERVSAESHLASPTGVHVDRSPLGSPGNTVPNRPIHHNTSAVQAPKTKLEEVEARNMVREMMSSVYWKKSSPNSLQLRPGYDVYIKRPVLQDLMEHYGPDSISRSGWFGYAWRLVLHMLGGVEAVIKIKTRLKGVGVDQLLKEPAILAVMGHCQEVFSLEKAIVKSFFKQKMNNNMGLLLKEPRTK